MKLNLAFFSFLEMLAKECCLPAVKFGSKAEEFQKPLAA